LKAAAIRARLAGQPAPTMTRPIAACLLALLSTLPAAAAASGASTSPGLPTVAQLDRLAADSVRRWESSAHGQMLMRILPKRVEPSALPESDSIGARLTSLYCVQCHHLPNPAMHDSASWPRVVERMLPRMRGEGNMGRLMAEMMVGPGDPRPLAVPSADETSRIVEYLRRHALRPVADASPLLRRALEGEQGRMFAQACSQCHALPDPAGHSAGEWPAVVRRMEQNMQWMNRVVGTRPHPDEPQFRVSAITDFLQRFAQPGASP
jgi:hypothetical protein